jgi:hypothetical protein
MVCQHGAQKTWVLTTLDVVTFGRPDNENGLAEAHMLAESGSMLSPSWLNVNIELQL